MTSPGEQGSFDAFTAQLEWNLTRRKSAREQREFVEPRRAAFRQAAAVLSAFDPLTLQPVNGTAEPAEALGVLIDDAAKVANDDEGRGRWALLAPVRRQTLQLLGTRERMLEALQANPGRLNTTTQLVFESYIRGDAPRLDEQDLAQLQAALTVVRWLDGILPGLPDPAELRRRIEERGLYAAFEQLAGKHFGGRAKELHALRDYVGLYPPEFFSRGNVTRQIRMWARLTARAPLVIYGPGGVGKSTLIAKLSLDHGHPDNALRIPFAYLDFDNPTLIIEEPATLLAEALRQLGIQYFEHREACESLSRELQEELLDREDPLSSVALDPISEASLADQASGLIADRRTWGRQDIERFAELVRQLPAPSLEADSQRPPLLFVLDTFEEVQYRSETRVERLWEWLADLQDLIPTLRTVVSGRAPVHDLRVNGRRAEELELGDLDDAAAIGFLEARGVTRPGLAAAIVRQVGGSPLSLTLAAEVLRREGEDAADQRGIKGVDRPRRRRRNPELGFSAYEETIEGVLYRRILDHIKDPDVRRLAHPGLVLRRVTPELILTVLAGPCDLDVRDIARATELFLALRREITLVSPAQDGSLRHRPDVRRLMLGRLERDRPDQVHAIHEGAAAYYAVQDGDIANAEQIYHRLKLGDAPKQLEALWRPGVGEYLRGAFEELPVSGQVFLAQHMDLVVSEQIRRRAELQDWEQLAARRCRQLLQSGDAESAGRVLRERRDRSLNSPLNLIEVVWLITIGNWEEAFPAALHARAEAQEDSDRKGVMRSCVALAHLADRSEAWLDADDLLDRVGELARLLDDPVTGLGVLLQRLVLRREAHGEELEDPSGALASRLRGEGTESFLRLPHTTLTDNPELTRAAVAELGPGSVKVLRRGLQLLGLGAVTQEDVSRLASIAASATSDSLEGLGFSLGRTLEAQLPDVPTWNTTLVNALKAGRLDEFIDRVLEAAPGETEFVTAVAEVAGAHTSWSLYLSVYATITRGQGR